MEPPRPPPPRPDGGGYEPSGRQQHQSDVDRRSNFSNRERTHSSGSVRGAFGPTKFDNANKHGDIFTTQKKAMKSNFSRINQPTLPQKHFKKSDIEDGHSYYNHTSRSHQMLHDDQDGDLLLQNSGLSPNDTHRHRRENYDESFDYSDTAPVNPGALERRQEIDRFSGYATGTYSPASDDKPSTRKHKSDYGSAAAAFDESKVSENMSYSAFYSDGNDEPSFFIRLMKTILYDSEKPEFTSAQQTTWAVLIGFFMGIFTALWNITLETSVEFVWVTIPTYLLEKGIFTDLKGWLPLPHYMWICPAIFGGLLSYITASYVDNPVPGQNEWIESLHRVGIMDHKMFFQVVILSTLGMMSGLSLGPEMPLVLAAGMVGSKIALMTKQSVLSARVINLTACSAAIGGFFGFPMAGALFVLELPHRMGLQYFEALSPAVISSIISVIVNRIVLRNDIKGYFDYPFLEKSLPSSIFYIAVVYGLVGTLIGVLYANGCLYFKSWVHDWFHPKHSHDDGNHEYDDHATDEIKPLIGQEETHHKRTGFFYEFRSHFNFDMGIAHEPTRAGVAGTLVGAIVGVICMFLPHSLFWGEAQLQTLIDKGASPLPVFEYEPTNPLNMLTSYGFCMVDYEDARAKAQGFSTECAVAISLTKIVAIGLSLGTGLCGGHFWGPLYVGAAASHVFVDVINFFTQNHPGSFVHELQSFPCVAMICIMGSTHVVTYRCHTAIMLILTLTISTFKSEIVAGQQFIIGYSAIFPLLVVSCFVPLMLARDTVFYAKQRCRGDIVAIPQVLCEPMQEGITKVMIQDEYYSEDFSDGSFDNDSYSEGSVVSYDDDEDFTGDRNHNTDSLSVSVHSHRSRRSVQSLGKPHTFTRVSSFGLVDDLQPNLLGQARERAASNSRAATPTGGPSIPRHRRKGSAGSFASSVGGQNP